MGFVCKSSLPIKKKIVNPNPKHFDFAQYNKPTQISNTNPLSAWTDSKTKYYKSVYKLI